MRTRNYPIITLALAFVIAASSVFAGPTDFTYQAQLTKSGTGDPLVSTSVDVTIDLYDGVAGSLVDTQVFNNQDLSVSQGAVSLSIDSSALDLTGEIWIEVTINDDNDVLGPETLSPRQQIQSVPFALNADFAAENLTRTLFVKPTGTQSASPTGTLTDPFTSINDAYALAKTMGPGFFDRVTIMLTVGEHTLSSTLVMDTPGIDLVGMGEQAVVVRGAAAADPMISMTAATSGAWIRNLNLQGETAGTNVLISAAGGGRIADVDFRRSGGAAGTLLSIAVPSGADLSVSNCDIYGDVAITSYGNQTTFNEGFILGSVTSTGNSPTAAELLTFSNMSTIGGVSFLPASGVGILGFSNVPIVASIVLSSATVFRASSTNFVTAAGAPLSVPDPSTGSLAINCMGDFASLWSSVAVASGGNVAGFYSAFTAK